MALNMVKEGYVAVAVDNAAAGEASDLECYDKGWNYDYDVVSRFLLELGWSWLGYTSYLDMQVLNWMKAQSYIRKDRIVISGFSLGTEPSWGCWIRIFMLLCTMIFYARLRNVPL